MTQNESSVMPVEFEAVEIDQETYSQIGPSIPSGSSGVASLFLVAFTHQDMTVINPLYSSCGRFEVDPLTTYGISPEIARKVYDTNVAIIDTVYGLADQLAAKVLSALGAEGGDVAAHVYDRWQAGEAGRLISYPMAQHAVVELSLGLR